MNDIIMSTATTVLKNPIKLGEQSLHFEVNLDYETSKINFDSFTTICEEQPNQDLRMNEIDISQVVKFGSY